MLFVVLLIFHAWWLPYSEYIASHYPLHYFALLDEKEYTGFVCGYTTFLTTLLVLLYHFNTTFHQYFNWYNHNLVQVISFQGKHKFIDAPLREKRPNTQLFLVRIFLYSDWIRRYRKIRTRKNSVFGHISRNVHQYQIRRNNLLLLLYFSSLLES